MSKPAAQGAVRGRRDGLRPLRTPRPLADDAADLLRELIFSGKLRQGQRLVEAEVARELNVSRGPVREAFQTLRAEGLLRDQPRRGTFVVRVSVQDVQEIYGLRAAIEARAAKVVVRHGTNLAPLRDIVAEMGSAASAGDSRAVSRTDLQFHETLCGLTANRRVEEVYRRYVPLVRTLLHLDERMYASPEEILAQHRSLLEALESGDAPRAAAEAEAHVDEAMRLLVGHLENLASDTADG
jgi:GntR family transcriptional regulator, gluconate operon transcriptional repressor